MKYNVEKLPDKPITIFHLDENWRWELAGNANECLSSIWGGESEPCYHIVYVQIEASMEDYQIGFGEVAYGPNALFKHPNLKMAIFVGTQPALKLAVDGLNGPGGVYEKLPISVICASTLDEAYNLIVVDRAG